MGHMDWVRDSLASISNSAAPSRLTTFGQRTGRDTIEPSLPAGWHYSLFPSPVTSASSPRSSSGRRSWVWESGSRSPGHWARRAGSALRLHYPVARKPALRSCLCRPSIRPWPAILNTHYPARKGGSKAPTVPRPGSPSILIPSAPGCASSASIGEATGVKAALEPDRSEVLSATPLTQTVPAIATAQPHASEAHLVSLNSKAFSGSAFTVAASLETSSSRYLAGKGRLEDLPRRFGKLVSSISMRTL